MPINAELNDFYINFYFFYSFEKQEAPAVLMHGGGRGIQFMGLCLF